MTTRLLRYKQMVFKEQSICKDSYPVQQLELKKYEKIPTPPPIKKKDIKYSHVNNELLLPYNEHVPFDLMWRSKPKEIIRTNPHDIQKRYEKLVDDDREVSQRTRPRLVVPPQVKVDDIQDAELRKIIIQDTYTTTRAYDEKRTKFPLESVKAPRPDYPAPANSVFLPLRQPSYVSPEWRRETVSWDKHQMRTHIDTEKEFWNKFHLYESCPSCEQSKQVAELRKMRLLR